MPQLLTSEEFGKLLEKNHIPGRRFDRIHRTPHVSIGEVFYEVEKKIGSRVQDRYEIIIPREGVVQVLIDHHEITVRPGYAILLKPGHQEALRVRKNNTHHCWCIIRKELAPATMLSRLAKIPVGFCVKTSAELVGLLDISLNVKNRKLATDIIFYESLALTIYFEFLRLAEESLGAANVYPEPLVKVIDFIEKNLHQPLTLNDIAAEACITKYYFIKLFHRYFKDSPMRYLWYLRIQKGAELLSSSDLNISEIASATGFQSPFHFSRLFKKVYGSSPKFFREKIRLPAQLKISGEKKGSIKKSVGSNGLV